LFRIVIPARYASTRLPGKALLAIAGKPMLQWVHERARAAGGEVLIATDDERIVTLARGFGAAVVMTAPEHASGTDRIAEVARTHAWDDQQIVVNVQGDEPLLPPQLIRQVVALLDQHAGAHLATLATPIGSAAEFMDPNAVKVVTGIQQRALYFSRAPIPLQRDAAPAAGWRGARRHVGLYAYRVGALKALAALKPTPLEQAEKLEQLRALEHGFDIRVADCQVAPGPDVNTAADLERVAALLQGAAHADLPAR
jgi:3-deoxy-manno-octulosonate cytidylyltransferase (CMP-KDO synthetase)